MRLKVSPYARLDGLAESGYWTRSGETTPVADGASVEGWDPAHELRFERALRVSCEDLMHVCSLAPHSIVRVSAGWGCDATRSRQMTKHIDVILGNNDVRQVDLTCTIPGALVALRVELVAAITLVESAPASGVGAAWIPGSVLWEDVVSLDLESDGSLFPMQWVDFSSNPAFPSGAAWFLDWDPNDLERSASGGFRLYLNSSDTDLKKRLEGAPKSAMSTWHRVRLDVARQLLVGAAGSFDFVNQSDEYEGDSVGAVLRRLMSVVFGRQSIESTRQILLTRSGYFEAKIQDVLGYMEPATAAEDE